MWVVEQMALNAPAVPLVHWLRSQVAPGRMLAGTGLLGLTPFIQPFNPSVLSLKFVYKTVRQSRGFGRQFCARRMVWDLGCVGG